MMMNVDTLTETARREYRLATISAVDALAHAINCGEALIALQQTVPAHDWEKWLTARCPEIGLSTATRWMRVAVYKEQIETDGGPRSIDAAVKYLRDNGLNRTAAIRGARRKYGEADRAEAARLRGMGLSYYQIAEAIGCSRKVVTFWLDDGAYEAQKQATKRWAEQKRKDRALLQRARKDELARRRGGDLSVAYSTVRRLAQLLQDGIDKTENADEANHLRAALYHLHECEGDLVKALRTPDHPSMALVPMQHPMTG